MMRIGIGAVVALLAISPAYADKKPVAKKPAPLAKGFWKVLVQPNAKWVLHETIGDKSTLTVETYDVRKLGKADVARLRWTLGSGKTKRDVGDSGNGRYTQLAVTAEGLYLLDADMDDAKVTAALAKKPARSDPPKAYQGTAQNQGRYLRIPGDGTACMGEGPLPDAGECADVCDGTVCISPTAGFVSLMGNYAPGASVFEQ